MPMNSPISDGPANKKEIERLEKKLKKASQGQSLDVTEQGTYYGLNKIKEKKETSGFAKFLVLLLFIILIVASIILFSSIISGKIDVYSLFKNYAIKN